MSNTLPPPSRSASAEIERNAFNAAFYELGLRWHWDSATYAGLARQPCERSRLQGYLEREQPHLLCAYEAGFLADAILRAKERCRRALASGPPHTSSAFDWAAARSGETGF